MNIRKAQHEDVPKLIPLINKFHVERLKHFGMGWDPKSVEQTITMFYQSHVGLVVEREGKIIGCIGGVIAPSFTDYNQKIFVESIWYIEPEHRGGTAGIRLIKLVELYCAANGINKIVMIGMYDENITRLSWLYHKLGYKELETHFIKDLVNEKQN